MSESGEARLKEVHGECSRGGKLKNRCVASV